MASGPGPARATGPLGMAPAGSGDPDDAPVVRFLQNVLQQALQLGASDLHFEPYQDHFRVRFRIDGGLHEMASPPPDIHERLASRIKVVSRLDIAEKRVPQDGRARWPLANGGAIDLRVSTLPTLHGEKIAIRILQAQHVQQSFADLGFEPAQEALLLQAIGRPHGMVLVTGPTGSGKTQTLYHCLHRLNQSGVNIATAEDPAEIQLSGINQVNINEKAGLDFAGALRAFLRQDPDIIMVGEIRDGETAEIAIKAAQTGHLLLSTLHTKDAPSSVSRLLSMGLPAYSIANSLNLVTAQRLARRLCPHCKRPCLPSDSAWQALGGRPADWPADQPAFEPVGCSACHLGYKGRIGLHQVMPLDEAMQTLVAQAATSAELAQLAARQGVPNLRQAGLCKAQAGVTSLQEVLRVT